MIRIFAAASLSAVSTAAAVFLIHAFGTPELVAETLGATVGVGVAMVAVRSVMRPYGLAAQALTALSARLTAEAAQSQAQNSLDHNGTLLRQALYSLGDPRIVDGRLYFGETLVNGDEAIVDRIRDEGGGTATIFLGDLRIATNVRREDGERAVGTRLQSAPVLEAVFGRAATYRGEAEILGTPYLTLYEPILVGEAVVGVLYVGVKKASAAVASAPVRPAAALDQLGPSIAAIRAAFEEQARAQREAITGRLASDDLRRRHDSVRLSATRAQQAVLQGVSSVLKRVAAGDLSVTLQADVPADYEALRADLNSAVAALHDTVGGVAMGCAALNQRTHEIGAAAEGLQRRSETQAASLEETAAGLN
jgi:methyl-accepting chemotaxis protein